MTESLRAVRLSFREPGAVFTGSGHPIAPRVVDFWRWAYSDLLSNVNRGRLAEFIVGYAIGATNAQPRDPWSEVDLLSASGIRVEVKSAAYIQSWSDGRRSKISFSIAPARRWAHNPVRLVGSASRFAEVYVFCLLKHDHLATLDPLQVDQWCFFVVPTCVLNQRFPTQKTLTLTSLTALQPAIPSYNDLAAVVETAAAQHRGRDAAQQQA